MSDFDAKYSVLCRKHGVKWNKRSPRLIGETLDSLRAKFNDDPNLNNVLLRYWDHLAFSFMAFNQNTGLSLSECVCMQKYAAIQLLSKG